VRRALDAVLSADDLHELFRSPLAHTGPRSR
jgi:hypothetical protein